MTEFTHKEKRYETTAYHAKNFRARLDGQDVDAAEADLKAAVEFGIVRCLGEASGMSMDNLRAVGFAPVDPPGVPVVALFLPAGRRVRLEVVFDDGGATPFITMGNQTQELPRSTTVDDLLDLRRLITGEAPHG